MKTLTKEGFVRNNFATTVISTSGRDPVLLLYMISPLVDGNSIVFSHYHAKRTNSH